MSTTSKRALPTNAETHRAQAWRRRYVANLNVCYWQEWVAARQRRRRRCTWVLVILGAAFTVLIAFVGKTWIGSILMACATVTSFAFRALRDDAKTGKGEVGIERWSALRHDTDELWQDGEECEWRKRDLEIRLVKISEAEKFCQSRECDPQDDDLVYRCQGVIDNRLLHGVSYEQRKGSAEAQSTIGAGEPPAETSPASAT
jgi:hypothetical protein